MSLRRRDFLLATGLAIVPTGWAPAEPAAARRLKLTNANTGDKFDGPYRDSTGPIPDAMNDLAVLLRDHHANKIGPVHVETLDFLADVMAAIGENSATILSAYRTAATNAMLRATMFGVAEKSQHLQGRAVDVAFDRRLADAEKAALRMRRGGVGWYPRSQFIHLDTGPVRHWQIDQTDLKRMLAGRAPGNRDDGAASADQPPPTARVETNPELARHLEVTDEFKKIRDEARRAYMARRRN